MSKHTTLTLSVAFTTSVKVSDTLHMVGGERAESWIGKVNEAVDDSFRLTVYPPFITVSPGSHGTVKFLR